jgi:hypothetical protein
MSLFWAKPIQSTAFYPIKIHFSVILHLCLDLRSGLSPSGFSTKTLYAFLFSPTRATCPALRISLDIFTLVSSTKHEVPHYIIFFQSTGTSTPLCPSMSLISFSRTPSTSVSLLMRQTKFQCHIKQQAKYSFVYFKLWVFGQQMRRQKILARKVPDITSM